MISFIAKDRAHIKDTKCCTFGEKNIGKPHRCVNKPRKPVTKLKANLMLREKTELATPQISLLNDTSGRQILTRHCIMCVCVC